MTNLQLRTRESAQRIIARRNRLEATRINETPEAREFRETNELAQLELERNIRIQGEEFAIKLEEALS